MWHLKYLTGEQLMKPYLNDLYRMFLILHCFATPFIFSSHFAMVKQLNVRTLVQLNNIYGLSDIYNQILTGI